MPSSPPEQRLLRVLHLARLDALSLVIVAAPAAVLTLCTGDRLGAAVGTGVALCGVAEWQGRSLLLKRQISGIAWLCAAQLVCLTLILAYAWNLGQLARADHILALLPSFAQRQLSQLDLDPAEVETMLLALQRLTAAAIALAALVYQGAMAFYYLRTAPVARAVFDQPPVLP